MNSLTALSTGQFSKLDRIAKEDPAAKVIGWSGGPIVRRGDGRLQRLVVTGRVLPIRNGQWATT